MLLAHGIVYSLLVNAFILKGVFTALLLYLVHHFRNPGTCFFYLTKTKLDRDLNHLNVETSKLEKNPRTMYPTLIV